MFERATIDSIPQLLGSGAAMDFRSSRVDSMVGNGWTAYRNRWTTSSEYQTLEDAPPHRPDYTPTGREHGGPLDHCLVHGGREEVSKDHRLP